MKANPGGAIAPKDVIGRDRLIANLWNILDQQSVIFSAERRMGKTTVIKKMEAEAPSNKLPIYRDLEGLRSPMKISTLNIQINVAEIAQAVDRIPFYIHHLISKLTFLEAAISQDTVTQTINKCLLDPLNPWKMNHYRDRIDNYYDDVKQNYALNILDILAVEPSLSFNGLWQRVKLEDNTQDKETARKILRLLLQDYYLTQDEDNIYSFRYKLVQQYWKISRGL